MPVKKLVLPAAALLAVVLAWALWPERRVVNLDSGGTTIIAFGDSLTAGYGAGAGEDYPSVLGQMIGATIINAGVSGDTTESALRRIDEDVLARDPRIVLVGLGGNDFLGNVPIEATEANLRTAARKIQAAGAMVVLLGYRFPTFGPSYEKMYERIAEEEGCLLVPDLLDGILSDPSLKSDAIHPNARGYRVMAERIAAVLRTVVGAPTAEGTRNPAASNHPVAAGTAAPALSRS